MVSSGTLYGLTSFLLKTGLFALCSHCWRWWWRPLDDDGNAAEFALSNGIQAALATGRSLVVQGDAAMIQTARMKFRRVCVLNAVDEEKEAEALKTAQDEQLAAAPDQLSRSKLMMTFQDQEKEVAARPYGDLERYETEQYAEIDSDVAAFLCAIKANLYRPPVQSPPEPEPEPTVADVDDDGLETACQEAGIELTEELLEGAPDSLRAALAAALASAADDKALAEARLRKEAADAELLALDRNKVAQLKGYKIPPAAAHAVLQATLLLLGTAGPKKASDWGYCRKALAGDDFWPALEAFDLEAEGAARSKARLKKINRLLDVEAVRRRHFIFMSRFDSFRCHFA